MEAMEMRPGFPCKHCDVGGCKIYSDRPEDPCKRFFCGWMEENSELPESLKPSVAGVIVLTDRKWRGWKVLRAIPTGKSIPEETLEQLRLIAQKLGLPLLFYERIVEDGDFTGVQQMAYGSAAFADAVKQLGPGEDSFSIAAEDIFGM